MDCSVVPARAKRPSLSSPGPMLSRATGDSVLVSCGLVKSQRSWVAGISIILGLLLRWV